MHFLNCGRQYYIFLLLDCLCRQSIQSKAGIQQTLTTSYGERSNASCAKKSVFVKNAWFGIVAGPLCDSSVQRSECKLDVTNDIRKHCLGKDSCQVLALKNIAARDHTMKEMKIPKKRSQLKIIYQCLKVFGCGSTANIDNGLFNTSRTAEGDSCKLVFPFAVKLNLWTIELNCREIRYDQTLLKRSTDDSYQLETFSPKIDISKITASCANPVFRFRSEKRQGGIRQEQRDSRPGLYESGTGLMVGIGVCGVVIIIGLIILAWSRQLPPPGNSNLGPYLAGEQRYPDRAHMVIQHEASGNAFRPSYVSAEHANSVPKSYWWSTTVNMGSQANSGSQFNTV